MAFGVKVKKIKTSSTYTIESFYEAIKDKTFTAGQPTLMKYGPSMIITFPELDSQNQVQIINGSFKKESQTFHIQKAQAAGVKNLAANAALDHLSGGVFGFKSVVGTTAKQCEELVEKTTEELESLGL